MLHIHVPSESWKRGFKFGRALYYLKIGRGRTLIYNSPNIRAGSGQVHSSPDHARSSAWVSLIDSHKLETDSLPWELSVHKKQTAFSFFLMRGFDFYVKGDTPTRGYPTGTDTTVSGRFSVLDIGGIECLAFSPKAAGIKNYFNNTFITRCPAI